jgi:hypothetical protein
MDRHYIRVSIIVRSDSRIKDTVNPGPMVGSAHPTAAPCAAAQMVGNAHPPYNGTLRRWWAVPTLHPTPYTDPKPHTNYYEIMI